MADLSAAFIPLSIAAVKEDLFSYDVYVAEYNENGTLLSIKSDEISDSVIIPFTCVNKSKVKVFIWKNDMKPLFNKVFTLN